METLVQYLPVIIQIPMVAALIWFTLELEKRFSKFVSELIRGSNRTNERIEMLADIIIVTHGNDPETRRVLQEYAKTLREDVKR